MEQFTIRDMERLSGIKSHTLRVWEQRYGIIQPGRKESQHRLYSNEDLKDLLRVVHLYHQGYRISKIANLGREGIRDKIRMDIEAGGFYQTIINRLTDASMEFDDDTFTRTLHAINLELGLETAMEHVVYPFLQKVGLMWMNDRIIPCQEHFASNLIRHMLVAEINALPQPPKDVAARILLFTPPEEYHEIPILYMQYLIRQSGLGVINLGVNVPLEGLEIIAAKRPVEILHFHLITNLSSLSTAEYLQRLCDRFPDKTIVISGVETRNIGHDVPQNARVIRSSREFNAYLRDRMMEEGIIKSLN